MSGQEHNGYQEEKALRILEALGAADEKLLKRSETAGKRIWRFSAIAAACICLSVTGVLYGGRYLMDKETGSDAGRLEQVAQGYGPTQENGSEKAAAYAADSGAGGAEGAAGESGMTEEAQGAAGESGITEEVQGDSGRNAETAAQSGEKEQEADGCPADDRRSITEKEARETELGRYLPARMPAGYTFESARQGADGSLFVCWRRGMDDIMISVSYSDGGAAETVDTDRPETYDERLYEIPYGETVPEEYREMFANPVFAAEDMRLEIVQSRMKVYADAGDTDTPRGSFSVLYPDGILLGFNGRGTADEIWTMLESVEP